MVYCNPLKQKPFLCCLYNWIFSFNFFSIFFVVGGASEPSTIDKHDGTLPSIEEGIFEENRKKFVEFKKQIVKIGTSTDANCLKSFCMLPGIKIF